MNAQRVVVITNGMFYNTITPGKALVLLRRVTDAIVDTEITYQVHSVNEVFEVPRAIYIYRTLNKYSPHELKFSKERVFRRDHYTCAYCGRHLHLDEATLDHIVPKSRGGNKDWLNVVTACKVCNRKKDAKTPSEAGMHLLIKPKVPTFTEIYGEVMTVPQELFQ